MTALSKLFRTTVFRLSLAYLVIFALGTGLVLGGLAWDVNVLLDEQIGQTVQAEITGLAEQYESGGIRELIGVVERRAAQPGSSLYLVTTPAGQTLAGNVAALPANMIDRPGLVETPYERPNDVRRKALALARVFELPGGFRLLVGRDLGERENLRAVIAHALFASLAWLAGIGVVGGIIVARRVLRRVDAMSDTAATIMSGDLTRRLPDAGSGDELDRLARNLNLMLDRIGELMAGVKQVSDNIAHDLRTPLTRLRNVAEAALRTARAPDDYRDALERIIAEADRLMAVFAALLLIARAEAGSSVGALDVVDLSAVARDAAELYEPVADEAGFSLAIEADGPVRVNANRELLGQALANLIDNALKYGGVTGATPDARPPAIRVRTEHRGATATVSVSDRGAGIAAADRRRVLDRFVRLEDARSQPGSGLGLSLASAVARLHGGTLTLEDNAPGLRAVLSFPLATEEAAMPVAVPRALVDAR